MTFSGFPKEFPIFLENLKKNNTKEWFQTNKKKYETHIKIPSQEFVSVMGDRLKSLNPEINAIPKVNKSLFRINRDTRFSNDKSPYKTNVGILFWEGQGKRMESSSFYFHLEDNQLLIGCGMYIFPKAILQKYRETIMVRKKAKELESIIKNLRASNYQIETRHYKRNPRGFEPVSDFQKEYLLYNGLTARFDIELSDIFHTPEIIDFTFEHFQKMMPLHNWIVKSL